MSDIPLQIERLLERIEELQSGATPNASASDLILRLKKSSLEAPPEVIAAAVETHIARRAATEKLGTWASQGYFTLPLLEQASRAKIATYRARRFKGAKHVLEIGTGTGSDTAALARVATHVTTIELDPLRAELARHNLKSQGITNFTLLIGDPQEILSSLDKTSFDALFADPARRTTQGERVWSGEQYSPRLSELLALNIGSLRAIKISPGLFVEPPSQSWSREFIGLGDECLEQTLWYGADTPDSSVHLADCDYSWRPTRSQTTLLAPPQELKSGYLVEAHATINRSQHLATYLSQRGIAQLANDVAYGWSLEQPTPDPLHQSFKILWQIDYSPEALAQKLSALGWTNRTEIKKRNFQGDPEQLRTLLKLPVHTHNAPFGTIFLFKWRQRNQAVLSLRSQGETLGKAL